MFLHGLAVEEEAPRFVLLHLVRDGQPHDGVDALLHGAELSLQRAVEVLHALGHAGGVGPAGVHGGPEHAGVRAGPVLGEGDLLALVARVLRGAVDLVVFLQRGALEVVEDQRRGVHAARRHVDDARAPGGLERGQQHLGKRVRAQRVRGEVDLVAVRRVLQLVHHHARVVHQRVEPRGAPLARERRHRVQRRYVALVHLRLAARLDDGRRHRLRAFRRAHDEVHGGAARPERLRSGAAQPGRGAGDDDVAAGEVDVQCAGREMLRSRLVAAMTELGVAEGDELGRANELHDVGC